MTRSTVRALAITVTVAVAAAVIATWLIVRHLDPIMR